MIYSPHRGETFKRGECRKTFTRMRSGIGSCADIVSGVLPTHASQYFHALRACSLTRTAAEPHSRHCLGPEPFPLYAKPCRRHHRGLLEVLGHLGSPPRVRDAIPRRCASRYCEEETKWKHVSALSPLCLHYSARCLKKWIQSGNKAETRLLFQMS